MPRSIFMSTGNNDLPTQSHMPPPLSPRRSYGSPLRSIPFENIANPHDSAMTGGSTMMPSPSKSYAFPPPSPDRRTSPAHQRASTTGTIRQRRSSPLLHEIQGPSRRLSSHQVLLLTPFGGPVPPDAMTSAGGSGMMARGSSSMGGPRSSMPAPPTRSFGMAPQASSVGMGRDTEPSSSTSRPLVPMSQRFNTRHQSLVQPVNPSPLSQPMATIKSGSEQGSESGGSSHALSRDQSSSGEQEGEQRDGLGPLERVGGTTTTTASVVPMMRSNSLPVMTLRELDALKDKDGELGIARGTHWAWVSGGDDDEVGTSPELPAMSRTTPPIRPFAFQDPFAPLGTLALGQGPSPTHAMSTAPDYHYSPTAEPRRMSEATSVSSSPWSAVSPVDGRSRGASVITVTPATSALPIAHFSPPVSSASTFNSRASMSAIDQDQPVPYAHDSPRGTTSISPTIRPRILRYKTSPARFTGLGLDIVVKSQSSSSGSGSSTITPKERRRSSQRSLDQELRRRSIEQDPERRRSSGTSVSSAEGRKGTWAVVDVVDTLSSTTDLSIPSTSTSSIHSLRSSHQSHTVCSSPRESVYTIEHVSSRSTATLAGGGKSFHSLPSRKGKGPAPGFAFENVVASEGFTVDPLAFPRRGSLAVLSQTALGPWAAKAAGDSGDELLGAPKGNWQDRRGSWAEGWVKK